jgi:hypothetical protein
MKSKKLTILLLLCLVFTMTSISLAFALGEETSSTTSIDAWEISRQLVAEIEAQKADQSTDMTDQTVDNEYLTSVREAERQIAETRYQELQIAIQALNQQNDAGLLSQSERVALIGMQDEALDLSLRYELLYTVTDDDKLQTIIDTLASEGDAIDYLSLELTGAESTVQIQSIQRQIFLAESYVALADDVKSQWDAGASVDDLLSYINVQREQILTEADTVVYDGGDVKLVD